MKTLTRYALVPLLALLPACGQQLEEYDVNEPAGGDIMLPAAIATSADMATVDCPDGVRCSRPGEGRAFGQLPDRDVDSMPDHLDRCPDVAGPYKNQGCPPYAKILVHNDRLELKESIQFAWNQHKIAAVSHAVLDEVVKALKDNKSFRVRIQGHASSDGPSERNQTLSENRAKAVLTYLVDHGVAKDRLQYWGFSSSEPVKSNATRKGRVANRRVVFKVDLVIVRK